MRQAFFVAVTHIAIGGNTLRLENQVLVDAIPPPVGVIPPTIATTPTTGATPTPVEATTPAKTTSPAATAAVTGTAADAGTTTPAAEISEKAAKKKGMLSKFKTAATAVHAAATAPSNPGLPVIGLFWRVTNKGTIKLTDDVVSEALDEVDGNHDGFLEQTDIPGLIAAMQKQPYAVLCKYYWEKHREPTTDKIGLVRFKELTTDISPIVGSLIKDAKHG